MALAFVIGVLHSSCSDSWMLFAGFPSHLLKLLMFFLSALGLRYFAFVDFPSVIFFIPTFSHYIFYKLNPS